MDCTINTERNGEAAIVVVTGYIDAHTFEELEDEVEGLLDNNVYRIGMDLSRVSYSSSAGIGVLVSIRANCMANGGGLVLINPAEVIRNVMQSFGIWDMFKIVPDKTQAIDHLNALAETSPATNA